MQQNFDNKTIVITGGGTGIGKDAAASFLAAGANVVINGRRENVLHATAAELDPSGERIAAVAGDIANPATSKAMIDAAVERFGGVDVLVNNAGVFKPTPFLDHSSEDFDWYIGTILAGTFYASQAAIPQMQQRGGGSIINIGSMWAMQAVAATPSSAYSAAKAGVHMLTKNLAIEHASDKIRVNCIAPAVVETPVYDTFIPQDQVATVLDGFNAFHPLGRNGQPADVREAILFFASDKSQWITGTVLPVDGGVTAGRHAA